jgi:hypothetical protein
MFRAGWANNGGWIEVDIIIYMMLDAKIPKQELIRRLVYSRKNEF